MSKIYRHSDKAAKEMYKRLAAEMQNLMVGLRFDELNVLGVRKNVNAVFKRLDKFCRARFKEVGAAARRDAMDELGVSRFAAVKDFVITVLAAYNLTTKYVYTNEWERKRDRLVEGIIASRNRLDIRDAVVRTTNLLKRQLLQYADEMTDAARIRAYKDMGVTHVMWHTQHDGKVCKKCDERDGKIYPIDDIPEKHYHCRCYITAVQDETK